MKLKVAQVIGLNTDQKAAQVSFSQRDDQAFLAVLEVACDDAFTKGRQVLSELEDFYFEFDGTAAQKLTATFEEAQKKFSDGVDFSLGLSSIWGKVLYLTTKGQVEVYLKRADKLSPLNQDSGQLISGFINAGDRLLFSTTSLVTSLGSELGKLLSLPIETFEEEVGSKMGEGSQSLAALTIEIAGDEPQLEQLEQNLDQDFAKPVLFQAILTKVRQTIGQAKMYFPKSGRARLIAAGVVIVVLGGGLAYQYKLSLDKKIQAQFNQTLNEAKDDFNSAKGLASLNPADAKTKLDLAKGKIDKALILKPNNSEAQNLKKQIEQEIPSILQQSEIADFPLFLDLDLIKKSFQSTWMSLSAGKLLLFDPTAKTLVAVDISKKSNQILAGSPQLGDAVLTSLNGNFAFVYSKDKGILRVDILSSKVSQVAKIDDEWGEVKDLYGFAGNVYLLDKGQIWKYLPTTDGYSDKREYLNKITKVDLAGSIRMQIESSIYLLKSGGEILRFTRGDKDNFSYAGLDKGVKDPKSLFVSSDTDNLYLLDSGNSRLLILTKTGSYKGQMTGSRFATATDLVADEAGKKVYLLEGSKIFSVDLK